MPVMVATRALLPIAQEWDWQMAAACRGMDVDIFFHPYRERKREKERRIDQARAICNACPVLDECRRHALAAVEPYGVWGGLSEEERAESLGLRNLRYPARSPQAPVREGHGAPLPLGVTLGE